MSKEYPIADLIREVLSTDWYTSVPDILSNIDNGCYHDRSGSAIISSVLYRMYVRGIIDRKQGVGPRGGFGYRLKRPGEQHDKR